MSYNVYMCVDLFIFNKKNEKNPNNLYIYIYIYIYIYVCVCVCVCVCACVRTCVRSDIKKKSVSK